ncbi:MAG: NrdH-redoxin, partial [bacterium]|nr:NrdH-redoxin [bacterium]
MNRQTTQPKVVVFTTPTCSWCRVVKQHLKKNNIRFKEIDVGKDERAARDMVRRTG